MSIQFSCDRCGRSFSVDESNAGHKARCKCGNILRVPGPVPVPSPAASADVPPAASPATAPAAMPAAVAECAAAATADPAACTPARGAWRMAAAAVLLVALAAGGFVGWRLFQGGDATSSGGPSAAGPAGVPVAPKLGTLQITPDTYVLSSVEVRPGTGGGVLPPPDTATQELLKSAPPAEHARRYVVAGKSPCGRYVIYGGIHGAVAIRELASGNVVWTCPGDGQDATAVRSVGFSPTMDSIQAQMGEICRTWSLGAPVLVPTGSAAGPSQPLPACMPGFTLFEGEKPAAFVLSADGRMIACARGRSALIWDAATGAELKRLGTHDGPISVLTFSPDGARLATGGDEGFVKVWDVAAGKELRSLFAGSQVARVQFILGGSRLVSYSIGGKRCVRLWDVEQAAELASIELAQMAEGPFYALNADESLLAAGKQQVVLIETRTGRIRRQIIAFPSTGGNVDISGVALSADGTVVAAWTWSGAPSVWAAQDGSRILAMPGGLGWNRGRCAFITADGRQLVWQGDKRVQVFDCRSGAMAFDLHEFFATARGQIPDHALYHTLLIQPERRELCWVCADGSDRASQALTLYRWSGTQAAPLAKLATGCASVQGVRFSADGTRLLAMEIPVAGAISRRVMVWEIPSGKMLQEVAVPVALQVPSPFFGNIPGQLLVQAEARAMLWGPPHPALVSQCWIGDARAMLLSDDGLRLAVNEKEGMSVRDAVSGATLATITQPRVVNGAAFFPDGRRLAVLTGLQGQGVIRDLSAGTQLHTLLDGGTLGAVSPSGLLLASGSAGGVQLVETTSGKAVVRSRLAHAPVALAFSPDGRRLASAGRDGTIKVWNATSHEELLTITGHRGAVLSVAYVGSGDTLLSSGADGTVRLWDASTGKEQGTLSGHFGAVNAVVATPDGRRIASAGQDGTVALWDRASGRRLSRFALSISALTHLRYSDGGRTLTAINADGQVQRWDVARLESLAPRSHEAAPAAVAAAITPAGGGGSVAASPPSVPEPAHDCGWWLKKAAEAGSNISDPDSRALFQRDLALVQARSGDITAAMATVEGISAREGIRRGWVYSEIAMIQFKAGDAAGANATVEAIGSDGLSRVRTLCAIAEAQHAAGNAGGAAQNLGRAQAIVKVMPNNAESHRALDAANATKAVLAGSAPPPPPRQRLAAAVDSAAQRARSGENDAALADCRAVRDQVRTLINPFEQLDVLVEIMRIQDRLAAADERTRTLQMVEAIFKAPSGLRSPHPIACARMAEAYALAGGVEKARRIASSITVDRSHNWGYPAGLAKAFACQRIARAQAHRGDGGEVLAWIQAANDHLLVAYSCLGAGEGMILDRPIPIRPAAREVSAPTRAAQGKRIDLAGGLRIELVELPAGHFTRQGTAVRFARPFHMSRHEITQAQWLAVMGRNPSEFVEGPADLPVENVSWEDCQAFCRKVSQRFGHLVRLPSEAEWEYACRAGSSDLYCFGGYDRRDQLDRYAWFAFNAAGRPHPVGGKQLNVWGLADMHGNVAEWCQDAWHNTFATAPVDGSARGPEPGNYNSQNFCVIRGGSYGGDETALEIGRRSEAHRQLGAWTIGLRIVADLAAPAPAAPPPAAAAPAPARPSPSGRTIAVNLGGNVNMSLVLIPAGSFIRGKPASVEDEASHVVTITEPFYLGACEVTNAQYRMYDPRHDSGKGLNDDNQPVVQVRWEDVAYYQPGVVRLPSQKSFCIWLSQKLGKTVRLPTEAEWEYACRAGSSTRYAFGDDPTALDEYAWFADNAARTSHPVGAKRPNAWGLLDMHGNAREWTDDYSGGWGDYPLNSQTDPRNGRSTHRSTVGGSWLRAASMCRSNTREPGIRPADDLGFRILIEVE